MRECVRYCVCVCVCVRVCVCEDIKRRLKEDKKRTTNREREERVGKGMLNKKDRECSYVTVLDKGDGTIVKS